MRPFVFTGVLLLIASISLSNPTLAENAGNNQANLTTPPPIQGTIESGGGGTFRFTYYFDHNALKDCVQVGDSLVGLTESGNLLRFDAKTLTLSGQAIVPGRGTAITLDDRGRLLVGTQEGEIDEVHLASLASKRIAKAEGRIVWLSASATAKDRAGTIVAVVNNYPEVMPRPGEPFKDYDARSSSIGAKRVDPFFVAVFSKGKERILPFRLGSFAMPNAYFLDGINRLWMGTDKGEWGGECAYMDLRSGKVHSISTEISGLLGFLHTTDGRLLAFGGMSHIGSHDGYVAQVTHKGFQYMRQFQSNDWQQPLPDKVQQMINQSSESTAAQERRKSESENMPRGPIDLMAEDVMGRGFWVVSAHILYKTESDLTQWRKVVELGGRWHGGRRYSVGNTPTVNRLITGKSEPDGLLVAMGRDGLERVSDEKVERFLFATQLESSVIDIWRTSSGTVLLGDDDVHVGWRLEGNKWRQLLLFPDRKPPDPGNDWYFAEPFGNDGGDIFAFAGANISPGERDLSRLDAEGNAETIDTWQDSSSRWDMSFLTTSEGKLLRIRGNELSIYQDKTWRRAGESSLLNSDERKRMLIGRRYVLLARTGNMETFLDAELGDLVQLRRSSDGIYRLTPMTHKGGQAPSAIFDAVADRDDWLLIATARGLFRFRPQDGRRQPIPGPSQGEEIKSICRDEEGRFWAAGDHLYVSPDEGRHWDAVKLPMLARTYTKRLRPDPQGERKIVLVLHDQGVVFIEWRAPTRNPPSLRP